MILKRSKGAFRFGHTMAVFGFFISLITLIFQGSIPTKTIAFGTSEIASLSNQYRTNSGLAALSINGQLTNSAQSKADHMAANNYFAHDAPDGTSPWFFFSQAGYNYTSAGENLALSNKSASSVVDGWYDSDGHRANMMSTEFTEVGYGIAFTSSFTYNGKTYLNVYLVAAHYGKPTYTPPAPSPEPTPQPVATPSQTTAPSAPTAPPTTTETPPASESESSPAVTNQDQSAPVAAPSGFSEEPENTTRSGTYTDVQKSPPSIPKHLTYAGMGTGGLFVAVGSTVELRRLLRHESLFPKLKHKK